MNRKVVTLIAGVALLGCETSQAVEALQDRLVLDARFLLADSPHSHVEAPEMTINVTNVFAASGYGQRVEGSLDVLWETCADPTSTPIYKLRFLSYTNFAHGGQPFLRIVSTEALKSHLVGLGYSPEVCEGWINRVHEKGSASMCTHSIPNVMMPRQYLAAYGLQG
jgi:hypothetical protein